MDESKVSHGRTLGIGTKVFLFVVSGTLISLMGVAVLSRRAVENEAMENLVTKARAITQEAENARNYVAKLHHERNAFDKERLMKELKEAIGDATEKKVIVERAKSAAFYYTVPVVAAWTVAQENAEKAGYKFKVPATNPRNPNNEPDAFENAMLQELASTRAEELYRIDKDTNSLRYMSPVKLSAECMLCHGTVKDYPEGNGKDPLGFTMEGWKIGDQHGAFEVIADLAPMQARVASSTMLMAAIGAVALALTGVSLFWYLKRKVTNPLRETVSVLTAVAGGDLTQSIKSQSNDEVGQMSVALTAAIKKLRDSLVQVRDSAQQATTASHELAASSQTLSSSSQQQAAALEESASSLSLITESARGNATAAERARDLATQSRQHAEASGQVVTSTIEAMKEINEASRQIEAITSTIDEIAFQTNLLALNAAVEAARAGEQGKGFAVVAAEVRALAQRSATAAREIKTLIQDSVKKVEHGSSLVERSGKALDEIVISVRKATELVEQIAEASQHESQQIEQVNKGVSEIDRATQSSAAQTEELSSVADSLSTQAKELQSIVNRFQLTEAAEATR